MRYLFILALVLMGAGCGEYKPEIELDQPKQTLKLEETWVRQAYGGGEMQSRLDHFVKMEAAKAEIPASQIMVTVPLEGKEDTLCGNEDCTRGIKISMTQEISLQAFIDLLNYKYTPPSTQTSSTPGKLER